MNPRAPDRQDRRSKLAGGIGTLVVHAGAALFLVSQVRTTTATPPVYAVNLVAAPAPTERKRIARDDLSRTAQPRSMTRVSSAAPTAPAR